MGAKRYLVEWQSITGERIRERYDMRRALARVKELRYVVACESLSVLVECRVIHWERNPAE